LSGLSFHPDSESSDCPSIPSFTSPDWPAMHALDYAVVAAYLLLTVGLGVYFGLSA
jgi:hypothetical protein